MKKLARGGRREWGLARSSYTYANESHRKEERARGPKEPDSEKQNEIEEDGEKSRTSKVLIGLENGRVVAFKTISGAACQAAPASTYFRCISRAGDLKIVIAAIARRRGGPGRRNKFRATHPVMAIMRGNRQVRRGLGLYFLIKTYAPRPPLNRESRVNKDVTQSDAITNAVARKG